VDREGLKDIADRLMAACDAARTIAPMTAADPGFAVDDAYEVLFEIASRREARGWRCVGRKIGFSNRSIWPRYGVDRPMWAHVFAETVQHAKDGCARVSLAGLVQPRIEPEVVFGLRGPVPVEGSARDVLEAVDWMAPGFELVQSHFPDWKFRAPDCTAAFGLHGRLVVGTPQALDSRQRDAAAEELGRFELALYRDGELVERGGGANVLGSPALALQHLARVLEAQRGMPALRAGELVTTGTLTDAWPLQPGTRWRSDYGSLGLPGLELDIVEN
jgi:2-keto-4-pentenoate hydratase